MDEVPARYGIKSVGLHDTWKFLQGITAGFIFGDLIKVAGDGAILRDAGESGFDFLDFSLGKEAACHGVAVLLERGFHFIQINGGGKSGRRGACGAHRAVRLAFFKENENGRTCQKDGLSYRP
jgi:hypothetical protein